MSNYVPGLEGVIATRSRICSIDGEKGILAYRGYPIDQLAAQSSFEETTLLLLDGELPDQDKLATFSERLRRNRRVKYNIREMMKHMPPTGHPMEMLQSAMASLGMFYPGNECLIGEGRDSCGIDYIHDMTVKIIARMPVVVSMWEHIRKGYDPVEPHPDLSTAANFLYMMRGEEPDPDLARIMDVCLVLHAEHTLNASTFAARVVGSALAAPYAVISAAIAALSGPLHGGANERVVTMLRDIGTPERAADWLQQKLENRGKIWGFGHREYKVKDPRATILQRLLEKLAAKRGGEFTPLYEVALALEEAASGPLGGKGVYPNVDYYSGILYAEMGIPLDQFTPIFAISRAAGWLAHWREQLTENRIYRPTQIYDGKPFRDYLPLDQR